MTSITCLWREFRLKPRVPTGGTNSRQFFSFLSPPGQLTRDIGLTEPLFTSERKKKKKEYELRRIHVEGCRSCDSLHCNVLLFVPVVPFVADCVVCTVGAPPAQYNRAVCLLIFRRIPGAARDSIEDVLQSIARNVRCIVR